MNKVDGKEMFNACHEELYRKMFPWYVRLWHRIKALFIKPKFSKHALIKAESVKKMMKELPNIKFDVDIPKHKEFRLYPRSPRTSNKINQDIIDSLMYIMEFKLRKSVMPPPIINNSKEIINEKEND